MNDCNDNDNEDNNDNSIISIETYDSQSIDNESIENDNLELSSSFSNNYNKKEKKIYQKIYNSLKCKICFKKKENNLKYCHKCDIFICEKCIKSQKNNSCRFCNGKLIKIKIIEDMQKFLDIYQNNLIKNEKLKEQNEKLKKIDQEKDCQKCPKHDKKVEYYCFYCHQKLCAICLSIFNEEIKRHEQHLAYVNEISLLEKYRIDQIIKSLEYNKERKKILEETKNKLELYNKNIDILFDDLINKIKYSFDIFKENINLRKNCISRQKNIISRIKNNIYEKFKNISLQDHEINFDIDKTIKQLEQIDKEYNILKNDINNLVNINSSIELHSFNFSFLFELEKNSQPINQPINIKTVKDLNFIINIQEVNNNNICITVPYCIKMKSYKYVKKNILFPILTNYNNGAFKKVKKQYINDDSDNNNNIIAERDEGYNNKSFFIYDKENISNECDKNSSENISIILNDEEYDETCFDYKLYIDKNKINNNNKFNFVFLCYSLSNHF